ncbi:MAG: hypothetical protein WC780_12020 [Lentimicrobiaceae bacterium]|jgi:hypothetical protein
MLKLILVAMVLLSIAFAGFAVKCFSLKTPNSENRAAVLILKVVSRWVVVAEVMKVLPAIMVNG